MDSPCIKQTVCKVLKIFQYGKYLVAYVLKVVTKRQRLSDGSTKQYHYSRKQFDITFSSKQEKDIFESRLQSFKQRKGFKLVKDVFEYILESEHESQN